MLTQIRRRFLSKAIQLTVNCVSE